jgi:hypothetical protein
MKKYISRILIFLRLRKPKQPDNWREKILHLYPEGKSPLASLLKGMSKSKDPSLGGGEE